MKTARLWTVWIVLLFADIGGTQVLGQGGPPSQTGGGAAAQVQQDPAVGAPAGPGEPAGPGTGPAKATTPEAESPGVNQISLSDIEALKKQVQDSKDLSDEGRNAVLELCERALADLGRAGELKASHDKFVLARQKAPAELEEYKKELAQPETEVALEPAASEPPLNLMEQRLKEIQSDLEAARKRAAELDQEPKIRSERIARMPEEVNEARNQLQQIRDKLNQIPSEMTISVRAGYLALLAAQQRHETRLKANQEEQLFYGATVEWLGARRDLAARQVRRLERLLVLWQDKVSQTRRAEAEKTAEKVRQESIAALYAHPVIKPWTDGNLELAQFQKKLVDQIDDATRTTGQMKEALAALESNFNEIQARVAGSDGVNNVLGVMLLTRRNELANVAQNRQAIRQRAQVSSQAFMDLNEYDNLWSELRDIEKKIAEIIDQADPPIEGMTRDWVAEELRKILTTRKDVLQKIVDYLQQYASVLATLDGAERQFVNRTQETIRFVNESILWVRSAFPLRLKRDLPESARAARWLLAPEHWRGLAVGLARDMKLNFYLWIPGLLVSMALLFLRHRFARYMAALSEPVNHSYTDRFSLTVKALLLTVLAAFPLAALAGLVGWRCREMSGDPFAQAIGAGCLVLVRPILFLELVHLFCLETGLATVHFQFRADKVRFVDRVVHLLCPLYFPAVFCMAVLYYQAAGEGWFNSLGRLAFMAGLAVWLTAGIMLFNPSGPLLRDYYAGQIGRWPHRLRYLWFVPLMALAPAFIVAAWIGYFFGAIQVFSNLVMTGYVLLAVLCLRALLFRWLYVIQLRLTYKERIRSLQESRRKPSGPPVLEGERSGEEPAALLIEEIQDNEPDMKEVIGSVSRQARALVQTGVVLLAAVGIWLIWMNFLPALNGLQKIELWQAGPDGVVTLWNLLLAAVALAMTVAIARNGPGLMELLFLQNMALDRGVSFAITTMFRYLIVIVGVSVLFTELGIGWARVQWLVAALSVGLGFGLQEIFANFISGLLILFDQPIRVGDVVTVDTTTGVVSKISIRATTITDWDRREYIVPNKEFITGRLLNWTLSSSINRIVVNVGVAYGSDVTLALKLMLQAAQEHPVVCKEPAPSVSFEGFGESALNLVLRAYLPDMDNRLAAISDLHQAIDRAFREHGVEIAFPQRDVHIRNLPSEWGKGDGKDGAARP